MFELSDETKESLSKIIGIPYDKLITMDDDEITAYIEKKNGKKIGYSKPDIRHSGSGDDSVLIDKGRFTTMEEVDKKIDKLIKTKHKTKKNKHKTKSSKNEDILNR